MPHGYKMAASLLASHLHSRQKEREGQSTKSARQLIMLSLTSFFESPLQKLVKTVLRRDFKLQGNLGEAKKFSNRHFAASNQSRDLLVWKKGRMNIRWAILIAGHVDQIFAFLFSGSILKASHAKERKKQAKKLTNLCNR